MKHTLSICLCLLAIGTLCHAEETTPPNVVILLADDLGWKDVGYHDSIIKTPNIDQLAKSGARLEQFYVMPVCSPTRACLMSGRHPIRLGLQSGVVRPWSKHSLPLEERTMADALREKGYATHICGKWHLGSWKKEFHPLQRGFDHHYGHLLGAIDYFKHDRMGGLDWHRDGKPLREKGYTTNLLGKEAVKVINTHDKTKPLFLYVPFNSPHTPLQAPPKYLKQYENVKPLKRKKYAAMVACMDDAIGNIVKALDKSGLRGNTLILFASDNGGPTKLGADNGDLRGAKGTLYEGGTRVPAIANWPEKIKAGLVINEPMHVLDWYPTVLTLGGASLKQKLPLDGKDVWSVIAEGKPSPHKEILLNAEPHRGAIRKGDWKLVVKGGLPRPMDGKGLTMGVELFNLKDDPNEKTNLAEKNLPKVRELMTSLNQKAREAVPPKGGKKDTLPKDFKVPEVWGNHPADE